IWHCDAGGTYSDVAGVSAGQTFLRGYQVTGADGVVKFTTIYPGWYSGRAVHIHVKVRMFDASNNVTTEATTQVFFDDPITDGVYANVAPYNSRSSRDTRNPADNIYSDQTVLLLNLTGNTSTGYSGSIALGVKKGTIFSGKTKLIPSWPSPCPCKMASVALARFSVSSLTSSRICGCVSTSSWKFSRGSRSRIELPCEVTVAVAGLRVRSDISPKMSPSFSFASSMGGLSCLATCTDPCRTT